MSMRIKDKLKRLENKLKIEDKNYQALILNLSEDKKRELTLKLSELFLSKLNNKDITKKEFEDLIREVRGENKG